MSDRLALDARGVCKCFGHYEALTDVDLCVPPGSLHGLLGPNGAGKTTLMRILLGLVRADAGTVRLLGREVIAPRESIPQGVAGFVETPAFYPYLSGRRNLALLACLDDCDRAVQRADVEALLEEVGLAAQADVAVGRYSAGMRQRLGLAAALLRRPRLLFLDEPTNSLDPAGALAVRALARRLADEGVAVVMSSHDMAEVDELCSTLTVINNGRVAFSGGVDQLRSRSAADVHAMRTSDDALALCVASNWPRVRATPAVGAGLEVSATIEELDAYVLALGRAGIAVRALEQRARSLESVFLELTRSRPAATTRPSKGRATGDRNTTGPLSEPC